MYLPEVLQASRGNTVPSLAQIIAAARPAAPIEPAGSAELTAAPLPAARLRIWELTDMQCPALGTCLTMRELRKLAAKVKLLLPPPVTDFDLHVAFVQFCKERGPASKLVNKLLDRKYASAIAAFGRARTGEQMRAFWRAAMAGGDVPGPFWAVLTRPDCPADLKQQAFGEVHMLSHLVGASNRADVRRLSELDAENQRLREAAEAERKTRREDVSRLRSEMDALREENRRLAAEARRQAAEENTRDSLASVASLERALREKTHAEAEAALLRSELASLESRSSALERRNAGLEHELTTARDDVARLEEAMTRMLSQAQPETCPALAACENCAEKQDGCGRECPRRVLYVGGRNNLAQHYRMLAESYGCELIHHDGGIESSCALLSGKVSSADAVICPVDCVSHEACKLVKNLCKGRMKPLALLRSSGLSSLARTLEDLMKNS